MNSSNKSSFGPQSIVWRFVALATALFFVECVSLLPYFSSAEIRGSQQLETRSFDLGGFTRIKLDAIAHLSSDIEVDITCGGDFSVSVSLDDNLYPYLRLKVENGTLLAGLQSPALYQGMNLKMRITIPALEDLELPNGFAILDGVNPAPYLSIFINEGSRLWLNHLQTASLELTMMNYSFALGALKCDTAVFKMSGGSNAWLWDGGCRTLRADLSGAGVAINEWPVQDADIVLREDSRASINVTGSLKAVLEGKALFQYYGKPVQVEIDSNPAAVIHQESGLVPGAFS